MPTVHVVEFWGDFACFSRPEASVERLSYPIPTHSAARNMLDAIYFHPQFRWCVHRVEVLRVPQWIALRRNEVKERINVGAIERYMDGQPVEPIMADMDKSITGSDEKGRTQRQTMALRNPRYRIHASIEPWPEYRSIQKKFNDIFERRLKSGQCYHQPYFGQREFVAFFGLPSEQKPIPLSEDFGLMVYDTFDQSFEGTSTTPAAISLFRANMIDGVVDYPAYESDEVLKPAAAN
jgi:CRISPR-associated protein Cas5d